MPKISLEGAFEYLKKDREGEVKLTLAIPLSDEIKVRDIPVQTLLKIEITYEDTGEYIRTEQAERRSDY